MNNTPRIAAGNKTATANLYSTDVLELLQQALRQMDESHHKEQTPTIINRSFAGPPASSSSSSSSEQDEGGSQEEDAYSLEEEEEESLESSDEQSQSQKLPAEHNVTVQSKQEAAPKITSSIRQDKKKKKIQKEANHISKQASLIPRVTLPVDSELVLDLPTALLTKEEKQSSDPILVCRSFLSLANSLVEKPVVVLLLRSGRFAGAVFRGEVCLAHRTCQRYTTRRGQGKAQSSLDSSKRKAQSMGAQLRRAGEENLRQDVTSTLEEWSPFLREACIVLLSCPPTMKKGLFRENVLARHDERLRKIPLDVGRPTFESVRAVYNVMMEVIIREEPEQLVEIVEDETAVGETVVTTVDEEKVSEKQEPEIVVTPLSPLHTAAAEGNLESLTEAITLLEHEEDINLRAGQDCMTPLHYAAETASTGVDQSAAASCVSALLLNGGANPCIVDIRNRPPYFLASHEKVRDAFRIARDQLGEDAWMWDQEAKVGPPLSKQQMEQRKEKAAEKKRRQRARQKEKKAREKAQAAEAERLKTQEEEERKQEEEAKRIRDGLKPKATASNACDFCQKVCKGKRRSQMFHRLEYKFCSSECVLKHKRELMAAAALSRMGG